MRNHGIFLEMGCQERIWGISSAQSIYLQNIQKPNMKIENINNENGLFQQFWSTFDLWFGLTKVGPPREQDPRVMICQVMSIRLNACAAGKLFSEFGNLLCYRFIYEI